MDSLASLGIQLARARKGLLAAFEGNPDGSSETAVVDYAAEQSKQTIDGAIIPDRDRINRRHFRRTALILAAVCILAIGAGLCFDSSWIASFVRIFGGPKVSTSTGEPTTENVVRVRVARVRAEDVPIYLTGIGTVQAYNTVSVKSRVDGQITEVLFGEGDNVKEDDPLVIIDPRPFQAQLAEEVATRLKDQALLDSAVLDMKRYDTLLPKNSISQQQADQQRALVDEYRAQVNNDDAQIDYARTQLEYTTIRAPINGRLGIRQVDLGNFVRASDNSPIVVITQLQPISAIFTIAAATVERTKLTLGRVEATVSAIGPDGKTKLDHGRLDLVDNEVDQSTGTIKLKASFPNKALKLWPGDFVNGRITVDVRRDGLTVPTGAVRHRPKGDFV